MSTTPLPEILHAVRLHKVNYTCDSQNHTVYFKEQAERACAESLAGWASPGHSKAQIAATEAEAIEKIRLQLKSDIEYWMPGCDLTAFSFTVAHEEIKDGAFWSSFRMVYGHNFKVHEPNEWR